MSEHIDQVAKVLAEKEDHIWEAMSEGFRAAYRDYAQALDDAGLLATPEHDREVAAKAWSEGCAAGLREANDKARGVQNNPAINPYERKTGETDEWR